MTIFGCQVQSGVLRGEEKVKSCTKVFDICILNTFAIADFQIDWNYRRITCKKNPIKISYVYWAKTNKKKTGRNDEFENVR